MFNPLSASGQSVSDLYLVGHTILLKIVIKSESFENELTTFSGRKIGDIQKDRLKKVDGWIDLLKGLG